MISTFRLINSRLRLPRSSMTAVIEQLLTRIMCFWLPQQASSFQHDVTKAPDFRRLPPSVCLQCWTRGMSLAILLVLRTFMTSRLSNESLLPPHLQASWESAINPCFSCGRLTASTREYMGDLDVSELSREVEYNAGAVSVRVHGHCCYTCDQRANKSA